MSLILDALNKSDQEAKDYAGAPSIDANHGVLHNKKDTAKMLLLAAIAILIFIAVILLASLVFKSSPAPNITSTHITTQPNIQTVPTPPITQKPDTIPSNIDSEIKTTKPKTSAVAELYAPDTSTEEIIIQEPEIIVATQNNVTAEEQALAQHLWNQSAPKDYVLNTTPTESSKTTTEKTTKTVNTPTAQAANDVEYSVHHLADTPFLHNLPVSVQNTIPTLMYAEHKYAEGFTIINKKKVLVGDKAAAGVTLEEILEDGATFSMGDIRFKLGAQSSWVNY